MEFAFYRAVIAAACFLGAASAAAVGQVPVQAVTLPEFAQMFKQNLHQPLPADAAQLPAAAAPAVPNITAAAPTVPNVTVVNFPSSGDALPTVDATVSQRISRDSDRIGSIAKKLLSVQQAISKVEKEALDKVFDIHSIKSFLNEHQAAVDKEKHLDQEIASGAAQEKALTGKLTQVNVNLDEQQADHDTRVENAKLKLAEGKSKIQQLKIQVELTRKLQKEIKMMPAVNAEVTAKKEKASAEGARVDEELQAEEQKAKKLEEAVKMVGMQLHVQVAYKDKCTAKIGNIHRAISAVKEKKASAKKKVQEKLKSASETQEGLLQENDLLRQRLRKAEANKATIKQQIAATKWQIAALQKKGKEAVEAMQQKLAASQQQGASVGSNLASTVANLEIVHKEILGAQKENFEMSKLIQDESGSITALRAKHSQLKQDLARIGKDATLAEANIVKAEARAAKSKAKAKASRQEAKASTDKVASDTKQLTAQVATAKKREEEISAKVEAATKAAQSSLVKKQCTQAWDKNHTEVRKLLENCDKLAEELQITRNHVDELRHLDELRQSLAARDVQAAGVQDVGVQAASQRSEDSADQHSEVDQHGEDSADQHSADSADQSTKAGVHAADQRSGDSADRHSEVDQHGEDSADQHSADSADQSTKAAVQAAD